MSSKKGGGGEPPPRYRGKVRLFVADLKDHACARELNQRSIGRIDKTGETAGTAAGIPHRAIIDDVGAAVRAEPEIGRTVEPGRVTGADEGLIAGAVAAA